jgi:hypothetical protein
MDSTLNRCVYEKLILVARARGLLTYTEIAPLVDSKITSPRDPKIAQTLHEICSYEVRHGRPMLGSVVVRRADKHPGKGYFKGAQKLGLFSVGDELTFWQSELNRVYHYWSAH